MRNLHKVITASAVATFGLALMGTAVHVSADDNKAEPTIVNGKETYNADTVTDKDKVEAHDTQGNPQGEANKNDTNPADDRAQQEFWVNSWDRSSKPIPETITDNALHVDSNSKLEKMNNFVPDMKAVWGNYTHDLDGNNSYNSTNNVNTQAVNFKTKWMLPRGFNIDKSEHGNYQGMIMANNSIYMVESLGTGANQGAIIRFDMNALKKMGLDKTANQQLLVRAFRHFSTYTKAGQKRTLHFVNYLNKSDALSAKVNRTKGRVRTQKRHVTNAHKRIRASLRRYRKVSRQLRHAKRHARKVVLRRHKRVLLRKYRATKKRQSRLIRRYHARIRKINKLLKKQTRQLRKLNKGKQLYRAYYELSKSITATPLINIGHGQTLAYNPKNQHLYLAQDNQLTQVDNNYYNQVTEIDPQSMQPVHQYRFKLMNNNVNMALHTLTFDNDGNAYFGVHAGPKGVKNVYTLYTGNFNESGVSFRPVRQMINWPGSYNQYLTYNRINNRVYMISNDMIISVPADRLRNGNLSNEDVHYLTYNTNREFESLAFDDQGYGYLLTLWKSELLHSNVPMD